MLAVRGSADHTSRVWTRRRVEQIRLTLGHSNQGVPYPCVVKLNHYTFLLFHNGNSTKLEIQSFGTLANLNAYIKFLLTSVMVLLQWASRSDVCLFYFKRWN